MESNIKQENGVVIVEIVFDNKEYKFKFNNINDLDFAQMEEFIKTKQLSLILSMLDEWNEKDENISVPYTNWYVCGKLHRHINDKLEKYME